MWSGSLPVPTSPTSPTAAPAAAPATTQSDLEPDRVIVVSMERFDVLVPAMNLTWTCGRCGGPAALGQTSWLAYRRHRGGPVFRATLGPECAALFG